MLAFSYFAILYVVLVIIRKLSKIIVQEIYISHEIIISNLVLIALALRH